MKEMGKPVIPSRTKFKTLNTSTFSQMASNNCHKYYVTFKLDFWGFVLSVSHYSFRKTNATHLLSLVCWFSCLPSCTRSLPQGQHCFGLPVMEDPSEATSSLQMILSASSFSSSSGYLLLPVICGDHELRKLCVWKMVLDSFR